MFFRLTSVVVPEYGRSYNEVVRHFQATDRERLVIYLKGLLDIELDANGNYSHYYSGDREEVRWTLEEVPFVDLA